MLRIRLRREGARSQPVYRIVVAEREHPRDGRFIEIVGEYNPRTEPAYVRIDEARALHYLQKGAQPSEPVGRLLKAAGTLDRLARLRTGEPLESLVAEAKATASTAQVNLKTRRDSPPGAKGKGKKAKSPEAAA